MINKSSVSPVSAVISTDTVLISKDRVCIRGKNDNFRALKLNGVWKIDYPEFNDLMDNFSELKEKSEIAIYSLEARSAIYALSN